MAEPLKFHYDPLCDVITIEGLAYSGELFRAFAGTGGKLGLALNQPFRITSRDDGVLTIERIAPGRES